LRRRQSAGGHAAKGKPDNAVAAEATSGRAMRVLVAAHPDKENVVKREIIRVEPLATYLEKYKAPASTATRHGNTIYVSGMPPFEPETGAIFTGAIERQTELVLQQMKLCVETAGSSLDGVLKVNVYVTSVDMFPAVNEVYRRFFPSDPPARIFINVPAWNGGFDIEVDCIAGV
jgi:2-iminobutanoate/2-iminopropanoate deaminase